MGLTKTYLKRNYMQNRVEFTAESNCELTEEEIIDCQLKAGFHPAGYGGPFEIKEVKDNDSNYVYTWWCGNSCD